MPVEEHRLYGEWSQALDRLKEANDRYVAALARDDKAIEAHKADLKRAQDDFNAISDQVE